MNQAEEIIVLKERVAVLERILAPEFQHPSTKAGSEDSILIATQAKRFVASYFALTLEEISGVCRTMRVVWPRWIAMHLAYKYSGLGVNGVGRVFNRDHGSVSHALEAFQTEIDSNPLRKKQALELDADFIARMQRLTTTQVEP